MRHLILCLMVGSLSSGAPAATEPYRSPESGRSPLADPGARASTSLGAVTGIVSDRASGLPLARVTVVAHGTPKRAFTASGGEFVLSGLSVGRHRLVFETIGYASMEVDSVIVVAGASVDLGAVEMNARPAMLSEVVVTAGAYTMMGDQQSIRQTLSSEDIEIMGWAEDITRAVQRIPGTSSDEYSAQFSVRGGETDEILVLLDGMEIYKPFHQKDFGGGLFSTVDIETIDHVDLSTGGFTAGHGDRMSGVLSMETKTPRPGERRTSLGISLMNLRAFSMGTSGDGRGSWLLSGRRAYLDVLDRLMGNAFKLKPHYYDLFGKVEVDLGDRHTLSVHGFLANDSYSLNERVQEPGTTWTNTDLVDTSYGNAYGWVSLESFLAERLHARTMLYTGLVTQNRAWDVFDNDPQAHLNSATVRDRRDLGLVGLKQSWAFEASRNVLFKVGVDVRRLGVTYDYSNDIRNEFVTAEDSLTVVATAFEARKKQNGTRAGLHFASRFRPLPSLTVETGVRYDHASYANDDLLSPRVGVVYSLGAATSLRAGWGHFYQSQGIDDLDIQFGDVAYHPAELAEHFVLGFEHALNPGLHFRAEAYYKEMTGLRDSYHSFRDIDEFFPEARDDLIRLRLDRATSRGIELLIKRDAGEKLSWWFSYVLARSQDDVAEIDYDGRLVKRMGLLPRAWDQRHTFNMDANYRLNDAWHFNLAWKYRTGWPSTDFTVARKQREDGSFAYHHDHGVFRGSRVPSYQRLDARINRHFHTSRGKISVFLHAINVYNHANVIRYDHDILYQDGETFRADIGPETWFGITPFLGVSWEF